MAIELVEKDKLDRKAKKKINPETFIDLDNVRSIKSTHTTVHGSKTNHKVTFGIKQEADELSASLTSTIDTMDDKNRNTEATGEPPSDEQASTSVVSPYSSQGQGDSSCMPRH